MVPYLFQLSKFDCIDISAWELLWYSLKYELHRQKMYLWTCEPSEVSDQTAHLRSLIWCFTGRILDSQWCKVSSGGQRRLWSAFVLLIKIWTVSSENVLPVKNHITVNCLKIPTLCTLLCLHKFCFYAIISKILSGMANSVDPDQTAPLGAVWSGSALFTLAILLGTLVYKILGHLL